MAQIFPKTLITILVLSIFYFNLGSALVCWKCNPCPDPFNNASSSVRADTCSSTNTICVKNTVKVLNQPEQVVKGCVSSCYQTNSDLFDEGAFVDCCYTDYCNLSTRNQLSLPIYLLSIITVGFIFYYRQ